MHSIPKTVKEKCRGVNWKQLALKCAPYVIFGYVFNKVSWLYGQQAGDNTLQKVLDTINGMGGAFVNPFPSFMPRDLLVGVGCGIGFRMVVYYKAKNAKKFRQGVEYGSARWGTAKDIQQGTFDELYQKSQNGEVFENLMDLILSRDNILLAYRNIKANKGSYTAGTDKKNITDIGSRTPDDVVKRVRFIVTGSKHGYRPKPVRRKDIPKPNGETEGVKILVSMESKSF